jgi:hypothetical protein
MSVEYDNDADALNYLGKRGIVPSREGILYFAGDWGRDNSLHREEWEAIKYLAYEWDYEWMGLDWSPEEKELKCQETHG